MKVTTCCLCDSSNLKKVVTLGYSGLANNLEKTFEESKKSEKYPLELFLCQNCNHVQLGEEVSPNILFENYTYETGVSKLFQKHFKQYSLDVSKKLGMHPATIVDIGCNDCILLDNFKDIGFKTIGIEPAKNLVEKYKDNHYLINSFLNEKGVDKILKDFGKVDVVTANNVFAHNRSLKEFSNCVQKLLKPNGLFFVEVQYLVDLIKNGYFDMIYHEHTSYHHIKPIREMMKTVGMQLVGAERVSTHGGSVRLIFQNTFNKINFSNKLIEEDSIFDAKINEFLESLNFSIEKFKSEFEDMIQINTSLYDSIYGYAAPAKAVTLLSVLSEDTVSKINFIIDDGELKQGKYLPGYGIPILSTETAVKQLKNEKSLCIIFAWNISSDIKTKILESELNPDAIVVPLPKLEIYNEF